MSSENPSPIAPAAPARELSAEPAPSATAEAPRAVGPRGVQPRAIVLGSAVVALCVFLAFVIAAPAPGPTRTAISGSTRADSAANAGAPGGGAPDQPPTFQGYHQSPPAEGPGALSQEGQPRPAESVLERRGRALVSRSGAATPADVARAHAAAVAGMICDAAYPPQFDDWHRLDLDGDGVDEHLVFFTLEGFGGGNNFLRYLNVYRYVEPVWFLQQSLLAGGKGGAGVSGEELRLADGVLSVDALLLAEDDAFCCPSVEAEARLAVGIGGKLTELPMEQHTAPEDGVPLMTFLAASAAECDRSE